MDFGTGVNGTDRIRELLLQEEVERFVLPNGLTVVFKEESSAPLTTVRVYVKSGSIHEGEHLGSGLSHFLEHMLFKGTERRAGREISGLVQENGGSMNAYTTYDRTVYYIDIPSEHTEVALDILSDAVFHSRLPEEEVEKERDVILREIDMYLDDPVTQLSQSLFETAFREHPYRVPIIGHKELFEEVTHEELAGYYRSRYVPGNAVLVVVGDLTAEECRRLVEKYFGGLPRRRVAPVFIPPEPEQLGYRQVKSFADVQLSHTGLGFRVPGATDPDTPALIVLSHILGQGMNSVLWRRLREEQELVHEISAVLWNPGTAGLFFISFTADPDKRSRAVESIHRELEAVLRDGIPEDLIEKTIRKRLVTEVNMRKTVQGQAARLGGAEMLMGLDYPRVFLEKLTALRPEDLLRVGRTYLCRERLTEVSLNPETGRSFVPEERKKNLREVAVRRFSLENGATLLLQPDHRLPSVHLRVIFRGGPVYEPEGAGGLTAILSTLLTKGTRKRTKEEIAELVDGIGGMFSGFSGNNTFGLSVEVLPDDIEIALDLIEEALLHPLLLEETFEREREAAVAGVKESLDDILERGRMVLREKFFEGHPFGREPEGTIESLEGLKVEDVVEHYRELVAGGNLVVSVVGDFDEEKFPGRLREVISAVPAGRFRPREVRFGGPSEPGFHREVMKRQQAVLFEAYPDVGVGDPGYYVGEVADELFSGMSSELFERVREELGLAYFVGSSRVSALSTGFFYFYAGTNPATVEPVFAEIGREIARVRAGEVTVEELRRCQRRLKARKRMGLQTYAAKAFDAGLSFLLGEPVADWSDYDRRIDAVTVEDLRDFAREYFVPEKRVRLVAGPEDSEEKR